MSGNGYAVAVAPVASSEGDFRRLGDFKSWVEANAILVSNVTFRDVDDFRNPARRGRSDVEGIPFRACSGN